MMDQTLDQGQVDQIPTGYRGRVLIVEDDQDSMNWLSTLLKHNQFEVLGAGDGMQAMHKHEIEAVEAEAHSEREMIVNEVRALRAEIQELRSEVAARKPD